MSARSRIEDVLVSTTLPSVQKNLIGFSQLEGFGSRNVRLATSVEFLQSNLGEVGVIVGSRDELSTCVTEVRLKRHS